METYTTGQLTSMLLELGKPTDGTKERLYARLLVEYMDRGVDKFCKDLSIGDKSMCKKLKMIEKIEEEIDEMENPQDAHIDEYFAEELLLLSEEDFKNSMTILRKNIKNTKHPENYDATVCTLPILFKLPETIIKHFYDYFVQDAGEDLVLVDLLDDESIKKLMKVFGEEPPSSFKKIINHLVILENSFEKNDYIERFEENISAGIDVKINKFLIKSFDSTLRKEKRQQREEEDELSSLMSNLSSRPIKIPKSRK